MATAPVLPQVSVEEYEQTPALFERHEYVDGRLLEKALPSWKHSQLQLWIGALLMRGDEGLAVGTELHSKLREQNWRIPDLAVQTRETSAREQYAFAPLLLAIEIRSPEDRWGEILTKFDDFHDWGVPFCWLFDPEAERAWTYHLGSDLYDVTTQESIAAGEIRLSVMEIFSVLEGRLK